MSEPQLNDRTEVAVRTFAAVETLARALHVKDARLQPTLDAILRNAVAAHPEAGDAGLILLTAGTLVPQATTGHAPQVLDLRQQETGEGPCLETARSQQLISVEDIDTDPRWPGFTAAARSCGVGSMLCAPLWAHEQTMGALTLYAAKPGAFGGADVKLIEMFSALAALALADAQYAEQLREAMASRDLIGQAKGVLMERHRVSAEGAFAMLVSASQNHNMKLAEVARRLAETGTLPS